MPIAVETIADLPLLRGLTSVELEEIASHLSSGERTAGTVVMRQGDPPEHPVYLLLQGSVDVIKLGVDGRDHVITSLSAPSVFGEIEVLARRPAIASVVTSTPVTMGMLSRGVFDELAGQNRACILKVIRNLATTLAYRLAATDERLATYLDSAGPSLGHADLLGAVRDTIYSGWHTAP